MRSNLSFKGININDISNMNNDDFTDPSFISFIDEFDSSVTSRTYLLDEKPEQLLGPPEYIRDFLIKNLIYKFDNGTIINNTDEEKTLHLMLQAEFIQWLSTNTTEYELDDEIVLSEGILWNKTIIYKQDFKDCWVENIEYKAKELQEDDTEIVFPSETTIYNSVTEKLSNISKELRVIKSPKLLMENKGSKVPGSGLSKTLSKLNGPSLYFKKEETSFLAPNFDKGTLKKGEKIPSEITKDRMRETIINHVSSAKKKNVNLGKGTTIVVSPANILNVFQYLNILERFDSVSSANVSHNSSEIPFPIYLKDSEGNNILDEFNNPILIQKKFSYLNYCNTLPLTNFLVDEEGNYIIDENGDYIERT